MEAGFVYAFFHALFSKKSAEPLAAALLKIARSRSSFPTSQGRVSARAQRSARMSSTSQKHRDFVAEPMGEKPVTDLPGIGPVLGERLSAKGFDKAYVVFGQFLVLKKNEELFLDWIKETCSANAKQGGDCYTGLNEWANSFL